MISLTGATSPTSRAAFMRISMLRHAIDAGVNYVDTAYPCVLDNSEASDWESAVLEWEVFDCEEDEPLQLSCICGKEETPILAENLERQAGKRSAGSVGTN